MPSASDTPAAFEEDHNSEVIAYITSALNQIAQAAIMGTQDKIVF